MLCKALLICLIGVGLSFAAEGDVLPPIPTTIPPHTTAPPETTTPAPTTPPPTTTPATTLPPTTTSTTAAPTTTTTSAPTTSAPSPTPFPAPSLGNWTVVDPTTNVTCIIAKMAIQLSVPYLTMDNKTSQAILDVPTNTSSSSGSCGNETQSLTISWTPDDLPTSSNSLLLVFSLNSTTKSYKLSKVDVTLYPDELSFPQASSKEAMKLEASPSPNLPSAPLAMSYRCSPIQNFNLTSNSTLSLSQVQLQAFHIAEDVKFGAASDCQAADSADIVPIAVGCALAGLVVVVLIAYLIGRRRSHAKGYLSM